MNVLTTTNTQAISTETIGFIKASKSDSTRLAYQDDIRLFMDYCTMTGKEHLPATPQTVADFLAFIATNGNQWANQLRPVNEQLPNDRIRAAYKASSIQRKAAAIATMHKAADLEPPTRNALVSTVMAGIKNTIGTRKVKKEGITQDRLYRMLATIDTDSVQGLRDRALLMLAFGSAMRRSELVALDIDDLTYVEHGLKVLVRKSKTDQSGAGQVVSVVSKRMDVIGAIRAYVDAAGIQEGALFRSVSKGGAIRDRLTARSVADIFKKYATLAGLDASQFSGHSTRRGFVNEALHHKADPFAIMRSTRHKSLQTLNEYADDRSGFDNNAGAGFM